MTIEISEAVNEEIIKMRKELSTEYFSCLRSFFTDEEIAFGDKIFISLPSINVKNKSTLCCIMDCCEIAKKDLRKN